MASDGTCIACGSTAFEPRFRVGGQMGREGLIPTTDSFGTALADIVRCQNCGHMQLERMPDEAELSEAYGEAASDDYVEEEEGQRATAREILACIEGHTEIGALADLGCWVGFLLDEARQRGWETIGVEPSEFASGYAKVELGLDVRRGDLFAAELPEAHFNAVFMGDVIEHIPEAGDAVERSRRLLAPGGVLAMALPDAGSRMARMLRRRWWSVIPTHVHYFTRASMARFLGRHGFDVLEMRTSPKAFTVRYYLSRLGGYQKELGRGLVGSAERVRLADRLWAPDFRDRMLVIAHLRQRGNT